MIPIKVEHLDPPSDVIRIKEQLERLDEFFIPKLSERVNVSEYAVKLSKYAHLFYAVCGGQDCGHCAVYVNEEYAFISSIGIDVDYQSKKIGTLLLSSLKEYCPQRGIHEIKLEVHEDNILAVGFYKKNGFTISKIKGKWYEMICLLAIYESHKIK